MLKRGWTIACMLLILGGVRAGFAQQVATDVPTDHWAYAAVQDLASKGLIYGYPPSGDFFGGRTVSRYEMATIIERVLEAVDQKILAAQSASTAAPAPTGLTPQEIAEVKDLTSEYGVELTVIGANVQKVQDDLAGVHQSISDLQASQQAALDILQDHDTHLKTLDKTKVDSGAATNVAFSALLQGQCLAGKDTATATGSQDTITGYSNNENTFKLRRAELRFKGNTSKNTYFNVMFDPSKAASVTPVVNETTVTNTSGKTVDVVTGVSTPNQTKDVLQDVILGYQVSKPLAFEIGQQKLPTSYESWGISSSAIPTVDRALINNDGSASTSQQFRAQVGEVRDVGFLARYSTPQILAVGGVFNDGGFGQDNVDDNSGKEYIYHVQYKAIDHIVFGGYQEFSQGVELYGNTASGALGYQNAQRQRQGGEVYYNSGPIGLDGEYAQGEDGIFGTAHPVLFQGAYGEALYTLSPSYQLAFRDDYLNPDKTNILGDGPGHESDYTYGLNYFLHGHNAEVQFNYVQKDLEGTKNGLGQLKSDTNLGPSRGLFEVQAQEYF